MGQEQPAKLVSKELIAENMRRIEQEKLVKAKVMRELVQPLAEQGLWREVYAVATEMAPNHFFTEAVVLIYLAFEMTQETVQQELPKFLESANLKDRLTAMQLNVAEDYLGLPRDWLYVLSGRTD